MTAAESEPRMATERDHRTTDEDVTGLPATPREEVKLAIQMDEVKRYTVRPGLMRLPVASVRSAQNAEKFVIELDHPFIDEQDLRFFIPKPRYWDPVEYKWPRILDWYGYSTSNQYELQTDRMYVRYNPRTDEWDLCEPPAEWRETTRRWHKAFTHAMPDRLAWGWRVFLKPLDATIGRVRRSTPAARTLVVQLMAFGVFMGSLVAMLVGDGVASGTVVSAFVMACFGAVVATFAGAIVFQPPGGEGA